MHRGADHCRHLLGGAIAAAREAGDGILEVYHTDFAVGHKEDSSPLTVADKRAHEIITGRLAPFDASIPLLSEEGKDIPYEQRRSWDLFWLVDPLDGTKEFIKKNGEFTVNIALIRERVPVLGVIYVPVQDVIYFAAEGLGAYRVKGLRHIADKEISIPVLFNRAQKLPVPQPAGRPYTIAASRSHLSPETEERIQRARADHGDVSIVSAGSSLKFCLVAEGLADEYPRFGPTMEWDTAAGQAIVQEAGGRVVDVASGRDLSYNQESLKNNWFTVRRETRDVARMARH